MVDNLIRENEKLVSFVLNKYYPSLRNDEDMYQIGLIGLWQAIETYDESRKIKFTTYAARCIRNRINIEIKEMFADKRKLNVPGFCDSLNRPINTENGDEELINVIPLEHILIFEHDLMLIRRSMKGRDILLCDAKSAGYSTEETARLLGISGQTVRRIWNETKERIIKECM